MPHDLLGRPKNWNLVAHLAKTGDEGRIKPLLDQERRARACPVEVPVRPGDSLLRVQTRSRQAIGALDCYSHPAREGISL